MSTAAPMPAAVHAATAVVYLRVSTREQAERGGEVEGFSIPAQRDACQRKAEAIGATVVEEFVDAGESAKSTDRPELQRLLRFVTAGRVDFVIVHKVDRLARNRYDDAVITAQLQASGARLVSVTENIDETPSGLLLHGIMSSIAEFYSKNLANEVIKGTQQKVSAGGTPYVAPIGYLNSREVVAGRESRIVVLDDERAPLIRWAFEAYATGDYTLRQLAEELEARGLTQRPTAKRAARPLPLNKLHEVLRNRYYLGFVSWRGVEHQGKHPALVTAETFAAVQGVLSSHRLSGERSWKHKHYLSGSLFCARCDARLLYGVTTGRRAERYEYFFCARRHADRTACDLPWLPLEQVEDAVARQWQTEVIPGAVVESLRQRLTADLRGSQAVTAAEQRRLGERVAAIRRERYKWAEQAMVGAVPTDIAREKQAQLGAQLLAAETDLGRLSHTQDDHEATLTAVLKLSEHCDRAYGLCGDAGKRDYNQAWFERLELDVDDDLARPTVTSVTRTPIIEALQSCRAQDGAEAVSRDEKRRRAQGPGGVFRVDVSNVVLLVELMGRYSRYLSQLQRLRRVMELRQQAWDDRPNGLSREPYRVSHRLSEAELERLAIEYRAGATGSQLAERYGLARSTVIKLLKDHGVEVRHPRVSEAEAEQIVALHQQGLRQSDIARQLGRHKSLIWHVLRRAGALAND